MWKNIFETKIRKTSKTWSKSENERVPQNVHPFRIDLDSDVDSTKDDSIMEGWHTTPGATQSSPGEVFSQEHIQILISSYLFVIVFLTNFDNKEFFKQGHFQWSARYFAAF